MEPFRLSNDAPPVAAPIDRPPRLRQRQLFSGLDCLPGQRDLFPTDGHKNDSIRALSIHGPWAWAIIHGPKRVENRTWSTDYRGLLAIHASQSKQSDAPATELLKRLGVELPDQWPRGVILGSVDLIDVVPIDEAPEAIRSAPFATGPYCWILANPKPLAEPLEQLGRQMLWEWDEGKAQLDFQPRPK